MKIFIIAAMSADGFIGLDSQHLSMDWRSKEDARSFIQLTKEAGVIVMGSTTYNTFRIRRAPPGRRLIVYTSKPETIDGDGIETTAEEPHALVERLGREGATAIAVGGGAAINKLFMDSGLVDEVYLTIEPLFFGQGVPLFSGNVQTRLSLLESSKLNDDTMLLHYAVKR